jgi:hypothetical protein
VHIGHGYDAPAAGTTQKGELALNLADSFTDVTAGRWKAFMAT